MKNVEKARAVSIQLEAAIRNRVNDMSDEGQAAFGFGYAMGLLQRLMAQNPKVLQEMQDQVDFMTGK
jgi:hypothetical protein